MEFGAVLPCLSELVRNVGVEQPAGDAHLALSQGQMLESALLVAGLPCFSTSICSTLEIVLK